MYIREVLPIDLARVYQIEAESFSHPYDINVLQQIINVGAGFLVAIEDGKVVGYVIFCLKEENLGHVISIAADRKFRGQKIATKLLTKVVLIFNGMGINKISLEVKSNNFIAVTFYKKFGFSIDRKVPDYYEDGQAAYVMYLNTPLDN